MSVTAGVTQPRAIGQLARFEGRKLLISPVFLAGIGMAVLGTALVQLAASEPSASWSEDAWTMAAGFIILSIIFMVATNRAAMRDHREHTVEQHTGLPLPPHARTRGLLLAMVLPSIVISGLLSAAMAATSTRLGNPTAVQLLHALQLPLLFVMFGALGIALARWAPSAFVAPVVAFGFYIVHPEEPAASWHVIWPVAAPETTGLAIWHLLYVAALVALFCIVSVARHGWRRATTVLSVAVLLVIATSLAVMVSEVCPSSGPCHL